MPDSQVTSTNTVAIWRDLDLSCHYAGLTLRTPLIVASSPLSDSADKIEKLAEFGAGAVVLRSLFEEDAKQTSHESLLDQSVEKHTEAYDYIREMGKMVEPDQYMDMLAEARRRTNIPIIASLNATNPSWWQDYAYGLERAGASAIELNFGMLQLDPRISPKDEKCEEQRLLKTLSKSAAQLGIPLTLKVPPHMANSLPLLYRIAMSGVRGMVYFNRYNFPDIDLNTMEFQPGDPKLSQPIEFFTPLRYLALHAALLKNAKQISGASRTPQGTDFALSSGVYYGTQIIKALLLGASTVQVCSALIQMGPGYIHELLNEVAEWMREKKIFSITQLRGQHNLKDDPQFREKFERLQYVKILR